MHHPHPRTPHDPSPSRRTLLRAIGVGLSALALAPILAACGSAAPPAPTPAPAPPQAGAAPANAPAGSAPASSGAYTPPTIPPGSHKLSILQGSHFVAGYDEYFDKFVQDWGKQHNVQVTVDRVPVDTVLTKAAAEVAANTGHDLTEVENTPDPVVFADKTRDVTALANALAAKYGGWIPVAEQIARINGVWKAIPHFYISFPGLYRKDLFDANGLKPVDSWDDLHTVGQVLKAKGNPVGFALSSCGDANNTLYGVLWSFGASVTARDGKTITINSPETKQALEYVQRLYKDGMTPEVLSWDNTSNNRLLASGVGSWVHNPISAYRSIPDKALQEKVQISLPPTGPTGRVMQVSVRTYLAWSWTKEKEATERFLWDFFAQWQAVLAASTAYDHPMLRGFEQDHNELLQKEAVLAPLQNLAQYAAAIGYPGPVTRAAGEVNNTYVIPTMFQKVMQGTTVDKAIADAEEQIKQVYAKYPV